MDETTEDPELLAAAREFDEATRAHEKTAARLRASALRLRALLSNAETSARAKVDPCAWN